MTIESAHDAVLNAVEDVELLSLRWGDVDGSLSREELIAIAGRVADGRKAEAIIEDLIEAVLLYAFEVPGCGERYRSRFAETMRLLVRTRQIFRNEAWRGAPPLVADFRIDLRPRRYPKRDRDSAAVAAAQVGLTPTQREVWRAIVPSQIARFQEEAVGRLLASLEQDEGVIVTAGTGSGKTLAFYLPVLVRLAELAKPGEFWTKAITIYPRNELLKDQLTEAYRNVRRAKPALNRPGRRPLRVGAYFGDTPMKAAVDKLPKSWRQEPSTGTPRAFVCPFIRCDCDGEMHWLVQDIQRGRERLVCSSQCGATFDEQSLPLTRDSIRDNPPDILFTTTEMLNRTLSDQRGRHLFGVRASSTRRPEFLLLDEAHTYSGVSGAQAALTLRRWRSLVGGPVRWVGLSATLEQAQNFFADLTGLPAHRVNEVTPAEDDMTYEGREYQIALRGDPASRAALLSTSIQASMLLARVLDPPDGLSDGRFGRKLFVFTDDLDVTHRLFDNLRDAEGYNAFGRFDPTEGTLAALRDGERQDGDPRARDSAGQCWRLPEDIGHPLAEPLVVARTTGRDPGVNREANVIVATSALEVGFNDPAVGAVLQHKAPRSFASFLQRRGRAGRDRRMRPLTVTVLSDYGRDRQLFQAFEHLFDPLLTTQSLPIQNQYVLRMQAAFALLDWIADRPRPNGVWQGYVWRTASVPSDLRYDDSKWRKHLQEQVASLVRGDEEALASFRAHLKSALNVDEQTVERLLWEPPRSILMEVAPTLLRRIYRDWQLAWPSEGRTHDRYVFDHPLPEAAPRTLFSDLNLPEVEAVLPAATRRDQETRESLPIQQALAQLAPGRVTRRFGDAYGGLAHWFPVPTGVTEYVLPISAYAESHEYVGQFEGGAEAGWVNLPVYRPWRVRLEKANPGTIGPTSNASLQWASGFAEHGEPVSIQPPARTAWRGLVRDLRLFLHQFRASVSVRRFATGARAQLKRARGVEQIVDVTFVGVSGDPAAVGYEFETDGLALRVSFKPEHELADLAFEPGLQRALRALFYKRLVEDHADLPRDMNVFQRSWVRQIFLLSAVRLATASGQSLEDSADALTAGLHAAQFEEVMDALLGVHHLQADREGDGDSDGQDGDHQNGNLRNRLERLKAALRARLADPAVRACLSASLKTSLSNQGSERGTFLRRTLEATLADALIAAATASAPRHMATEALVADISRHPNALDEATLWITESTVGGAGVLQALSEQYAREPRSLFRALEAALEPSDLESASAALRQTYELMLSDAEVARSVEAVRDEVSHESRARKREALLDLLDARGVEVTRTFVVSLNARVFAPGAGRVHDDTVRALLGLWEATEASLGIELDIREVAVLSAFEDDIARLGVAAGLFELSAGRNDRTAVLAGLLWPNADSLRRDALAGWSPFRKPMMPVPQLARAVLLDQHGAAIAVEQADWKEVFSRELSESGAARLYAPLMKRNLLRSAIVELQATPVHVGHLQLYPVLERVSKEAERLTAHVVLREQV
ncbi:protein DpdJ [Microvirga alba]|uniref:DEAD/DEAH box helicase n=1 Tax=Microvirga alba TaxID=2791025 RepID=A0A931BQK8_9HYPH|nr:protein DpdJ [Microvirga alba]MBF9235121.1 DEAD/DEAH box helicase [Microvirga alba]